MPTEALPATTQGTDEKRQVALLKAIGLDRAAPEQREIALAIATRYDLDLLLKHLVLIDGRPYITRDGLLHIAHRSGVLDGIETTVPEVVGEEWRVLCSVYRKDMSRPFTYAGRYPTKGGNAKFAPEMATKVAESMALRRAFDISAPTQDERWDLDVPPAPPEPAPSLAERAAAKAAEVAPSGDLTAVAEAVFEDVKPEPAYCGAPSPYADVDILAADCTLPTGHKGNHKNGDHETW